MGIFSKKKATVMEIGLALSSIPGTDDSIVLERLEPGVDHERVHKELMYLRSFVVIYATTTSLGYTTEKNAICDSYYFHLREMVKKGILEASDLKNEENRAVVYTNAVNTPHQNGPAWTVGVAFARLCGYELDIKMTTLGSLIFGNFFKEVSEFVKSYQIIL